MPTDLLPVNADRMGTGPASPPTILAFDSGLGGLTVFAELRRAWPGARFVYVADDAAFPYGALEETALVARVLSVMERFIALHAPDVAVIACNTASTLVLPHLRARFAIPFVGTVPAIKPAAASSQTKTISVLATPGTVRRDYTRGLIESFASGCRVTLVGSVRLAALAEAELSGAPASDEEIAAEIAPCFVEDAAGRTDAVVLACTHYPLLLPRLRRLAPWPVAWIDPAPAIARRVTEVIAGRRAATDDANAGEPRQDGLAVFTSGRDVPRPLREALQLRGLGVVASDSLPLVPSSLPLT